VNRIPNSDRLVIRWTIGDVHPRGFEMLLLSITCAHQIFGDRTRYVVCVNSISVEQARRRTGPLPATVEWRQVTRADIPDVLRPYCSDDLMQGMAWKLVPLRMYPERYELALDNDCILWSIPKSMHRWLESEKAFLLAEDVQRCLGSFDALCPPGAYNGGIRGLPPRHGLHHALRDVLEEAARRSDGKFKLSAEIEEQGLQAAAMCRLKPLFLVPTSEVSICSPFWPNSPEFGTCGAHFVGMNSRHISWDYFDRPADEWLEEHWARHRPSLYDSAGLLVESAA
jgi:hypothetical protein